MPGKEVVVIAIDKVDEVARPNTTVSLQEKHAGHSLTYSTREQLHWQPTFPLGYQPTNKPVLENLDMEASQTCLHNNNSGAAYFASSSWSFPTSESSAARPTVSSKFGSVPSQTSKPMNGGDDSTTAIPKISSSNTQPPQQSAVIELTDEDDFPDDEDLFMWLAEQTDSELDGSSQGTSCRTNGNARRTSILVSRNLPITSPFVSLESFTHEGIQLSAKVYVELKDGDFLKIVRIIQNTSTSQVDLRGWIFRRTREMNGVLDKKLNEVCWILHIDDDDPRDPKIQGMETRQVSEVVKRRRIRLTNQSFPALSFRDDREKDDEETVKNDRVLVCRYQYLCFYHNAKARAAYSWCEKGLHRLRAEDCDKRPDNNLTDEELRTRWRGATVLGGSKEGWMPGEKEFLRQEGVCHKGITSRSSLKAPSGLDFPIGDPMQRGSVAVLLTEQNLQDTVESAAIGDVIESNSIKYTNQVSGEDDDEDEVKEIGPASSIVFPREVPRTWRKSQLNSAGFNGWPIDPSDCDSDRGSDISALRQRLRQNSIQAQRPRHKSPRITVIDAQVKTSSRSGTLEKRYEGKITSTYFPRSNSSLKKRPADLSFDSPARPTKRANLDFHVETIDQARGGRRAAGARNRTNDRRQDPQDLDSSDSDRTLGRSQSPDPCQVWRTPKRARGYRTTNSGLLTPVSDQKTGRPKSPYGPPEVSLQHHPYAEKFHQTTPLSRREHSSLTKQAQRQALTGNEGFIIDLTSSQANPTSTVGNRNLNSSTSRQPRASAQFEPCQEFLSDLQPESTSLDLFPQMNSHLHSHIHSRAPANRNSHLKSSSTWPTACRGSHTYNRLSKRADATVAPGLSSHRVCGSPNLTHAANADIHSSKVSHRRYTFGDCFCGAGGMSRGAINAGLHINWGFDFNLAACQTYAKNFFGTQIYNVWANQFSDAKGDHKVDICHLSPPCQFFSAAHTIQGKDDDMNTASLFAIFNLLEKAKPRIVTLEQTSGLIRLHSLFFSAVVNMFTARGFSVRWRVMNCADFGLPQRRMRLFIIASCPGEALPSFPKPTHSSNPERTGLKPWTTINEAISKIPYGWPNHHVHLAKEHARPPQPGDKIATCITTSGGGIIHPSGKRSYTHREFACLQSFPLGHKFCGAGVKKQIGNAVPPAVATVLLSEVKKSLMKADGLI